MSPFARTALMLEQAERAIANQRTMTFDAWQQAAARAEALRSQMRYMEWINRPVDVVRPAERVVSSLDPRWLGSLDPRWPGFEVGGG